MDDPKPLTTEPISRLTLALFAGASGDHNPIHVDLDFARKAGMDDVFAHGMLSMAYLGRMLTDWIPQEAMREFSVRFTAITHVHDRVICTGRIVERFERGGEQSFKYYAMVYAGDRVTFAPRIADIYEKKNGALEFIVKETRVTNASGGLVAELRSVLVVRHG